MNSSRPYLVRALYEWIVDNDCTPHLLVNAEYPGVQVPPGFASDGQIVLNTSPSAVRHLHMDNQAVSFEGRFGGVAHSLVIPVANVIAIYARENGQGMAFEPEPEASEDEAEGAVEEPGGDVQDISDATAEMRRERSAEPQPPARPPRGSHLKVVK